MLPPPTLTFTIPSIQDNLVLDCRVYHPSCLAPTSVSHLESWHKKAVIVAHPYAPLGGCMDDPVVQTIAKLLLRQGFVVGMFNFRGAGSSKGRTSWQGKSEQQDYISFIGFMVYYLHHLSPPNIPLNLPKATHSNPEFRDLTPIPSQVVPPLHNREYHSSHDLSNNHNQNLPSISLDREATPERTPKPLLLLAGYSYGALITTLLPPILSSLLTPFQTPSPNSTHASIRLRALHLAASQNAYIKAQISSLLSTYAHKRSQSLYTDALASPKLRKSSGGVRVGGEEDLRRASHESSRGRSSFAIEAEEMVRKSVDRVRSIGKHGYHQKRGEPKRQDTQGSMNSTRSWGGESVFSDGTDENAHPEPGHENGGAEGEVERCKAIPGIDTNLQTAYLLVSPLQGFVHSLATMFSAKFSIEHEMKLTIDPTLALFGDDDIFVSVKKLRVWAEKLARMRNVGGEKAEAGLRKRRFRYMEVKNAGHFWHDRDAIKVLEDEISDFARSL